MIGEVRQIKKSIYSIVLFVAIILAGLLIQFYSGFFYSEPVLRVESVEKNEALNTQTVVGTLVNKESIKIETPFFENESVAPLYKPGNQLIVQKSEGYWRIISLKRDGYIFILVGIFIWTIILISGKKGLFSLVGLIINSGLVLLILWINGNYPRFSLVLLMSVYTCLAVLIAMVTTYGFRQIDARKILATLISVFCAFFICLLTMNLLKDRGLRYEELQFITRPYRSVFLAGLLIGAIGASMDIVVTLLAALDEIRQKNPKVPLEELMISGGKIAQDTVPSMVNVLMFAYLSGSIPTIIFFIANVWKFASVLDMYLSLEFLRILCGGFAIVLAVPAALLLFVLGERSKGANRI